MTEAAKNAIDIRYRLLDYIYTAMHVQSTTGAPLLNPMFFLYPEDANTFGVELQFFYGPSLLVSPVTEENATSVEIYLPNDLFYDFKTYKKVQGTGAKVNLTDIPFTEIPLHVKSGAVLSIRNSSAYTTTEVRQQPFNFLVAPDKQGEANGELYLDDGESIVQDVVSEIAMVYKEKMLVVNGSFGYQAEGNWVHQVVVLGVESEPNAAYWSKPVGGTVVWVTCPTEGWMWDAERQALTIEVGQKLDGEIRVKFE